MGNKLDPTKIEISDISKTHTCPLAKVVRKELRDRNIEHLKVVFSTEHPLEVKEKVSNGHRILPGSISFMSSSGGLVMASQIVKDILNTDSEIENFKKALLNELSKYKKERSNRLPPEEQLSMIRWGYFSSSASHKRYSPLMCCSSLSAASSGVRSLRQKSRIFTLKS